jgi:hypothetical protein
MLLRSRPSRACRTSWLSTRHFRRNRSTNSSNMPSPILVKSRWRETARAAVPTWPENCSRSWPASTYSRSSKLRHSRLDGPARWPGAGLFRRHRARSGIHQRWKVARAGCYQCEALRRPSKYPRDSRIRARLRRQRRLWRGCAERYACAVIAALNSAINAATAEPSIAARLAELGGSALVSTPADYARLIAQELKCGGGDSRSAHQSGLKLAIESASVTREEPEASKRFRCTLEPKTDLDSWYTGRVFLCCVSVFLCPLTTSSIPFVLWAANCICLMIPMMFTPCERLTD